MLNALRAPWSTSNSASRIADYQSPIAKTRVEDEDEDEGDSTFNIQHSTLNFQRSRGRGRGRGGFHGSTVQQFNDLTKSNALPINEMGNGHGVHCCCRSNRDSNLISTRIRLARGLPHSGHNAKSYCSSSMCDGGLWRPDGKCRCVVG